MPVQLTLRSPKGGRVLTERLYEDGHRIDAVSGWLVVVDRNGSTVAAHAACPGLEGAVVEHTAKAATRSQLGEVLAQTVEPGAIRGGIRYPMDAGERAARDYFAGDYRPVGYAWPDTPDGARLQAAHVGFRAGYARGVDEPPLAAPYPVGETATYPIRSGDPLDEDTEDPAGRDDTQLDDDDPVPHEPVDLRPVEEDPRRPHLDAWPDDAVLLRYRELRRLVALHLERYEATPDVVRAMLEGDVPLRVSEVLT